MINISADTYVKDVAELAKQIDASKYKNIYGIPRGGVLVALELSRHLGLPVADNVGPDSLIADDLIDSGRTLAAYPNNDTAVIYRKPASPGIATYCEREIDGWIVFFYDKQDFDLDDNVVRILQYLGEDAAREGLRDTPKKHLELLKNFLSPDDFELKTTSASTKDPVRYADIPFISLCECHIMPILGTVNIEFTPNEKTISLAEVTKLVGYLARKIQAVDILESRIIQRLEKEISPRSFCLKLYPRNVCKEMDSRSTSDNIKN